MTPSEYEKARRLLMRRDPILGGAIKKIGPCLMADRQRADHLTALVGAIVSQQLSTKAAATIFGRFVALFPEGRITDAAGMAALTDHQLRGVGFSSQKVGDLDALPDAEVIRELTAVKGFGQWTAEMFLMFRLHRPDVLPAGDLGIMNAIQRLYQIGRAHV